MNKLFKVDSILGQGELTINLDNVKFIEPLYQNEEFYGRIHFIDNTYIDTANQIGTFDKILRKLEEQGF